MVGPNNLTFHLTFYSSEVCWKGALDYPANRRVSDYVNDANVPHLVLNDAVRLTWENNSLRMLEGIESIAVFKRNLLVITPNPDLPQTAEKDTTMRIAKVPVRTLIHIPPLSLSGDVSIPPSADLLMAIANLKFEFLVATNVNLWHYKTNLPLGTDLKFALVHIAHIHAIEKDAQGH